MSKTYQCPGCGASLVYEEGTDSLVCPYCGTKVAINDIKDHDGQEETSSEKSKKATAKIKKQTSRTAGSFETDASQEFSCKNCGAKIPTDAYTAATVCPFCSSPVILEDRLSGSLKPDTLIPFAINREAARETFRKWTKSGLFTPKGFSAKSTLDSISGTYVPYWLFDYDVSVSMQANATKVRTSRKGDTEYTHTDHYIVSRETKEDFRRIPRDASKKMPDEIMERIEPFDYSNMKAFDSPYLSGYEAECTNFHPQDLTNGAKERAAQAAISATRATMVGYTTVTPIHTDVNARESGMEYSMLPVWALTYRWKDKDWTLYLNGQTGRKIGSLPIDWLKALLVYLSSSAVCTILAALIWYFLL